MTISPDPPPQQPDLPAKEKKGFTLSDGINIAGVIFTGIMAWFAYQSLQSSNRSVEISNKALELTRESIASSELANVRSDSMSAHSLELADQTSKANVELAKITKENLELSRKTINAQLQQYKNAEEKHYYENAPFLSLDRIEGFEYIVGRQVKAGLVIKSLRNQVIKGFNVNGRFQIVERTFIDELKRKEFKDIAYMDSLYFSIHPEKIEKYPFSRTTDNHFEGINSPVLFNENPTPKFTIKTPDSLSAQEDKDLSQHNSFLLGSGSIIYKNYLTKELRSFVFVFYIEVNKNKDGHVLPEMIFIFNDNMNYDSKKGEFTRADL